MRHPQRIGLSGDDRWVRFRLGQLVAAALCALWLGLPSSSAASVLTAMDLDALSSTAERILVGTVEKIDSHYLSASKNYIVTDVTVRCERNILGVPEGTPFIVRHLGGVVGELGQRVYGEASYRVGEQVLLFAAERQGAYYAVGMAQGALHVQRDPSGVARVEAHLDQTELISPLQTSAPLASPSGHSLDEVLARVQASLARRPQPRLPQRRE